MLMPVSNKQAEQGLDLVVDMYNSCKNYGDKKKIGSFANIVIQQLRNNKMSGIDKILDAMSNATNRFFEKTTEETRRKLKEIR